MFSSSHLSEAAAVCLRRPSIHYLHTSQSKNSIKTWSLMHGVGVIWLHCWIHVITGHQQCVTETVCTSVPTGWILIDLSDFSQSRDWSSSATLSVIWGFCDSSIAQINSGQHSGSQCVIGLNYDVALFKLEAVASSLTSVLLPTDGCVDLINWRLLFWKTALKIMH